MSEPLNFPAPLPSPPNSPQVHLHDDIFSTSAPSSPNPTPIDATLPVHNQDLVKLQSTHITEGYRAGISVSKSQYIQAGFDRGYEFGGKMGLVSGWVRGVAEGLLYAVNTPSSSNSPEVEAMVKEVRGLVRDVEREVLVEKLLGSEWINEDGMWKWEVLSWDGERKEKEGEGMESKDVDLDLVVQSHPVLRKWVGRVVEMAGKLGLDVNRSSGDLDDDEGRESKGNVAT